MPHRPDIAQCIQQFLIPSSPGSQIQRHLQSPGRMPRQIIRHRQRRLTLHRLPGQNLLPPLDNIEVPAPRHHAALDEMLHRIKTLVKPGMTQAPPAATADQYLPRRTS